MHKLLLWQQLVTSSSPFAWSTLVEGGKERYRPLCKLTLELVLANQNKINFNVYGLSSLPSGPVRFLTSFYKSAPCLLSFSSSSLVIDTKHLFNFPHFTTLLLFFVSFWTGQYSISTTFWIGWKILNWYQSFQQTTVQAPLWRHFLIRLSITWICILVIIGGHSLKHIIKLQRL